jgi:hypothetical protein
MIWTILVAIKCMVDVFVTAALLFHPSASCAHAQEQKLKQVQVCTVMMSLPTLMMNDALNVSKAFSVLKAKVPHFLDCWEDGGVLRSANKILFEFLA